MRRIVENTRRAAQYRTPIIIIVGTAFVLGGAGLGRGSSESYTASERCAADTAHAEVASGATDAGLPEPDADGLTGSEAATRSGIASGELDTSAPTPADIVLEDTTKAEEAEPESEFTRTITGSASYYANSLAGRKTASGVPYRPSEMIAAHKTLPFGTQLRVTNLANDRVVEVRVVDRGPYAKGRVLDLSRRAAEELDFIRRGHTQVRIEVLK